MATRKGSLVVLIGLFLLVFFELVYYQYKINKPALPKLKKYISSFIYDEVSEERTFKNKLKSSGRTPPVLVGTEYVFNEQEWKQRFSRLKYVLLVPHGLQWVKAPNSRKKLMTADFKSVLRLVDFLNSNDKFQAASCANEHICGGNFCRLSMSKAKTICKFDIQRWTMIVDNTGDLETFTDNSGKNAQGYECNIVDTAFVVRKEIFLKLKLRIRHGENTLKDFFVRSKGNIKIAKLTDCAFSKDLNYRDRGYLEGVKEFPDYSLFGRDNKILRIITPDKIEWTKCSSDKRLCPEKPLMQPQSLSSAVLPICCARVLNEMLQDTATALRTLSIDHRVVFGTALGAFRSKAIIPWSRDVDIAIKLVDYKNKTLFKRLQKVMGKKYYVGDYERNRRVIAHYPGKLVFDTSKLFTGGKIKKEIVYGDEVIKAMKQLLPVKNNWQERCYVDIYATYPKYAYRFNSSFNVVINGREYVSVANITGELETWYGAKYMTPVERMSAAREDIRKGERIGKRKGKNRRGREKKKGKRKKGKSRKSKRIENIK